MNVCLAVDNYCIQIPGSHLQNLSSKKAYVHLA